jgi:hypothetical protein
LEKQHIFKIKLFSIVRSQEMDDLKAGVQALDIAAPQPPKDPKGCQCRVHRGERTWEQICACCGQDLPVPAATAAEMKVCDKCEQQLVIHRQRNTD